MGLRLQLESPLPSMGSSVASKRAEKKAALFGPVTSAYASGESIESIAKRCKIGKRLVRRWLAEAGIEQRTHGEAIALGSTHRRKSDDEKRRSRKEYLDGYREDGGRELQRERSRRHRARNKKKIAKWRRENRTELSAQKRQWRKANPEKHKAIKARRRAHEGAAVGEVTEEQWEAKVAAYGGLCAYCRGEMERVTQDHVIPLSKGGPHTIDNLVPACGSCNSRKGNSLEMKPLPPVVEEAA